VAAKAEPTTVVPIDIRHTTRLSLVMGLMKLCATQTAPFQPHHLRQILVILQQYRKELPAVEKPR